MPSGTVTSRSPLVMMFATGWSRLVSKRRSRLVTMPTTRLPSTTGSPEIRCCWVSASTSRTDIVGGIVIGSLTTPLSKRLTFATSAACSRRRHVLVDDAEAAFLRDRDREARFGDRVHRRGQQRDVERDGAGEAGREGDVARNDEWNGREPAGRRRTSALCGRHACDNSCAQKWIIPALRFVPKRLIRQECHTGPAARAHRHTDD